MFEPLSKPLRDSFVDASFRQVCCLSSDGINLLHDDVDGLEVRHHVVEEGFIEGEFPPEGDPAITALSLDDGLHHRALHVEPR